VQHVCNTYGSQLIGALIEPYILHAAQQQAYPLSRPAKKPILISLKGASAAGKSSLRPMLQHIMAQQGITATGYNTISPDIWRRLLLDYESLGEAYKYAGALTSNEVNVIDSKLDRYIRDKAQRQQSIPHLLVDRFRFDSFASDKVSHILHDTYAKYIDTLYMYFVITAPEETVIRGWERGLQRGRYKSVEDFLGFSIEAYVGMPKLLFKWLAYCQPRFNYVFLDNSVAKGSSPKTIAFGDQDVMNIHNPMAFINIERYQKINIKAQCPAEVYPDKTDFSVAHNIGFLQQCLSRIPEVNFLDEETATCYLVIKHGRVERWDRSLFKHQLLKQAWLPIFHIIAPKLMASLQDETQD
jgi:chloramphenicol 3-O-phosphotransferase